MKTAFFSHPDCLLHEMHDWHPERPARLRAIENALADSDLDALIERNDTAPPARESDLSRVHARAYVEFIRDKSLAQNATQIDDDTSINQHTWLAATRAAGIALAATDAVIEGRHQNAFCSIRPPGHHAEPARAMGFCFFNNIAIAAAHALETHGLARVAIIDFDVHHGNGTQAAFANDPRVLMCSFFQHPHYPFSGVGKTTPNMLNIPLPAGAGGREVREVVTQQWLPRLHEFKPEMLFISAGFDAHRDDRLGGMKLVAEDFEWITRQLREIAEQHSKGRIVSCLEGGYNLAALGDSVVAHLRGLAGLAD
jgi:acetoin utilization deacetylase AcuC-like enzyme